MTKELHVIVFTMKGCPFCDDFKTMLENENINFVDRDIHEYEEEYQIYTEITNNEMVPSLLLIETDGEDNKSYLYAPERDYNELTEAVEIIRDHIIISGVN